MLGRLLLAASLLVAVPLVEGQSSVEPDVVDTTLYFHLMNIQDFPINTQRPQDSGWEGVAYGGPQTSTVSCIDKMAGSPNSVGVGNEYHTYRGYSSPSFVEYDVNQNGLPRTHPERGYAYNVTIDPLGPFEVHWFLATTTNVPGGELLPDRAVVVPNVIVSAVGRAGDSLSPDDAAYDTGPVLFQGATEPVTLAAGQATGPTGQPSSQVHGEQVGDMTVYEFVVPLTMQTDMIPRSTGFTLRIDVTLDNPLCNDPAETGSVMPNLVRAVADPEHEPRMVLYNTDPLKVTQVARADDALQEDGIVLYWNVTSPWGAYDVDVANETAEVVGPSFPVPQRLFVIQRTHEHYHLLEPVESAWLINTTFQPLKDGLYTTILRVPNLQHTAVAESRVQFRIEDGQLVTGPGQELPGPAPALLLVALAALASIARRP